MVEYNPREIKGIPEAGVPVVGIPSATLTNMFGELTGGYDIVDTDEPYILWENGSQMLWEDGENVLLENQKMRIWRAERR